MARTADRYVRLTLVCGHIEERSARPSHRVPTFVHCSRCKQELLQELVEEEEL